MCEGDGVEVADGGWLKLGATVSRRMKAWGWSVGLAWLFVVSATPAWAQVAESDADMTPPSEHADQDEVEVLARASAWMDEWGGDPRLLEAARMEIEQVLQQRPDSAEAHLQYARYLLMDAMTNASTYEPEGLKGAEHALDRAVQLDSRKFEAAILRADVYRLQDRLPEARAELERIEQRGDASPSLDASWSDVLMAEGKPAEALARCERVDAAYAKVGAVSGCALWPLWHLGRLEEVDRLYETLIDRQPASAWSRGNHARFLLCALNDAERAVERASQALELMEYGHARGTLGSSLYRRWAALANAGRSAEAEEAWATAVALAPGDPIAHATAVCHLGAARPVLKALRDTGRTLVLQPLHAVLLASEVAPDWLPGVFGVEVLGSGRGRGKEAGRIYLNSKADYRDPASVTVHFTADAAAAWREKHGTDADDSLAGKRILIYGFARQQRVDFTMDGMATGKHYYQTHIVVTDPDQVVVANPDTPPDPLPREPAPSLKV